MKRFSTLFLSVAITGSALAQIPNAGFETWTAHTGYDTPDSWGNLNSFTTLASVYTCEKGTTAPAAGSAYIKLTSKTVPLVGTVPGIAVTGNINTTTFSVSGGFPNTTRPAKLSGQWQYMASGSSDHAHIAVLLTKWNLATSKRDTVAFTDSILSGMAMSWTAFDINLKYYSGKYPDTAIILLASSGLTPVAGSYLWVDGLAFNGTVPSGVVTVKGDANPTVLYPNPASSVLNIYYYSLYGGSVKMNVHDMSGRLLQQNNSTITAGENNIPVNTAALPHGNYILRISDDFGGVEEKEFSIK